ncbi:MAG: histone deacetylase [Actinomycetota bacterium]
MSESATSELLVATHDLCWLHDPGPGHPESSFRLTAIKDGLEIPALDGAIGWIEAPEASRDLVERVHPASLIDRLDRLAAAGGGAVDPDTTVSADSAAAAARAAGAGLDLIDRLERGESTVGWSVVRPPGHHATRDTQMGFCLLNNVAVSARALADRGERVVIVDVDAHHGNGTQDVFYDDPNVRFISFHQFPLYPGTGRPDECGTGDGLGTTVNLAMPPGTTGDVYREALDTVVHPVVARFDPTWVLISAGFDGHRADPLTELGLTSADLADLVGEILRFAPPGRRLLFLEGGYDLQALRDCAGAVAATIVGAEHRPERPSSGGPGVDHVELARAIHVERGPEIGYPGGSR